MNIKRANKILMCMSLTLITFISCTSWQEINRIKNCTKDTLLVELTESDTLDDWMYWDENPKDTLWMNLPKDTTVIYVRGEKAVIKNDHYVLPDSFLFTGTIFAYDTYYIHAIKWQDVKHYPLEEIRSRKLYDTQTVTRKDFRDRLFEYRYIDSIRCRN